MNMIDKFLENNVTLRGMLDTYLELRLHLQEEGYSQEALERVVRPTNKMIELRERFVSKKNSLFKQIKDYGFEINQGELSRYIQPLLNKIDDITPLKEYGDNERDNIGNEDY
jgi:hypothetical protein